MSKIKPYEPQQSEEQTVNEAAMMYEASCRSVDDFMASIPVDLMQELIDVSIRDCKAGKGIPHEQIDSYITERMGVSTFPSSREEESFRYYCVLKE